MNFRTTILFFGLLLTMLWVFGLTVAHKRGTGDPGLIVPSLAVADAQIDQVSIKITEEQKELPEVVLKKIDDSWFLKQAGQQARVEEFKVRGIIDAVKDARHEPADVSRDRAFYGLNPPQVVVTLAGQSKGAAKEWQLFVGKPSADATLYFVSSSDRPDKVFAVSKRTVDTLLVKNPNLLRAKRLFDFITPGVTSIHIKKGDKELELKRGEQQLWTFVKPPLGFAGFEAAPDDDTKATLPKDHSTVTTVKSLLDNIVQVRVQDDEDFVPLGNPLDRYDLESKTAPMRIEIRTTGERKEVSTHTILIGNKTTRDRTDYYHVRLDGDEGVFQLNAKWLEPITQALDDPGKIRSRDVAVFDAKDVDHIVVKQGKDEIKFYKKAKAEPAFHKFELPSEWQMYVNGEKQSASNEAVETLLKQVLGKNAIVEFIDVPEAEVKKREAEWGLDAGASEISIYVNALAEEKKDEAKDEKKDEQKDDKKKEEAKTQTPKLKEGAKAVVTLAVGKIDKDLVHVRRKLDEDIVSRFTLKKEFAEKTLPADGVAVAYLDTALPIFAPEDAVALRLQRTTEKGTEVLEFQRRHLEGTPYWYVKDPLDPTGVKRAASDDITDFVNSLGKLEVKKWLRKFDDKEDLDKLGLKSPGVIVAVTLKKPTIADPLTAAKMAGGIIGALGSPWTLANVAAVLREADPGEVVTFELGKDTTEEKDKPGTFAKHSGSNLLFLLPSEIIRILKERDLYDRTDMLYAQGQVEALYKGSAALNQAGLWMLASPHVTGTIHNFAPDKVKEVRIDIRTPFELRSFHFARDAKDKTWTDQSNLREFQLDSDKVNAVVKDFAKLKTSRFVAYTGGPRGEHKLGAKEAVVKLELVTDDGLAVTLLVGGSYEKLGYFATSSYWPETVFFVPSTLVEPLFEGARQFAKERVTAK